MSVNCTPMVELAASTYLKTSILLNIVLSILAIPVVFWATWKLWSMKYTKLFHVNFKICIQLHLFGFMMHCISRLLLHSIDFYNYTFQDDPCNMIPNIYRCFILRLLYNAGLWITNATAFSLILERWLATRRSVTYEEESVVIGVFLAIVQFVVSGIPLIFLYWSTKFNDVTMYYCVAAQATMPYFPQLSSVLCIALQITARISFHHLHRVNKVRIADVYNPDENPSLQHLRNNNFHSTLSNRFQLEQNISSIACLKTFTNMSSIYIIFQSTCFILLMHFASSIHSYQYFATTELNNSFHLYSIVSIIILSRKMNKIRKSIGITLVEHLQAPHHSYFDNFKKQIA